MRFELTTSTLARLRSTPELRPHPAPARQADDKREPDNTHCGLLCKQSFDECDGFGSRARHGWSGAVQRATYTGSLVKVRRG
jgi:hypothetical protein